MTTIKKTGTTFAQKVEKALKNLKPVVLGDEFKIPSFAYKKIEGSFGLMTRKDDKVTSISWEGCRDRFQSVTNPEATVDFLFYHEKGTGDNVIDFLRVIEETINVKPEDRLEFRKTNNPQAIYVKMSPWWKYSVRRSFMSASLRAGMKFGERTVASFEKALFAQYYLNATKTAVVEFLSGRTGSKLKKRTSQNFPGWYNHFNGKSPEKVRETLVRILPDDHPNKPKKEEPVVEAPVADVPADAPVVAATI